MLDLAVRHRSHLARYRQIVLVLIRHGFGFVVGRLGLGFLVPFHWGFLGYRPRAHPLTEAEHLRVALEELGGAFIKVGQILSTRSDLLPPEYIAELSKLQDAIPPDQTSIIEGEIVREFGKPLERIFTSFDPEPLGSASIGQVHAARLITGEEVVVKVQRPNIAALMEQDISILLDMARLAERRTVWGQIYDLPGIVEEFAETLRSELDYLLEAANAERIRQLFEGDPTLLVPLTYSKYTTKRVLTMQHLHGIKINDLQGLDRAGIDRHELGQALARIILAMILEHGFFHADPHPGNYLVQPNGAVGLLDYGIVGHLDEETRINLVLMILAITDQDIDRVIDRLVELGVIAGPYRAERLRRDVSHLITLYYGRSLGDIDLRQVVQEFLAIARKHRLQVPTRLTLLGKTISMHQSIAESVDPNFNLAGILPSFVDRVALESFSPIRLFKRALPTALEMSRLAMNLPRRLDRLSVQAERGDVQFNVRIPESEHYLDDLNRMVNGLILGIITAAFIVALPIVMLLYQVSGSSQLVRFILALGFILASALGFWLLFRIIRGGIH